MSTETPRRVFPGKASAMLIGIATLTDNGKAHAADLAGADTSLTARYFTELRSRIDEAARDILGADNAAALREATGDLGAATESAVKELGLAKAFIESKFARSPDRRDALLNTLGFSSLYAPAVSRRQQEAMGQLLARFDQSMTPELEKELTSLGLPAARIGALRTLAGTYSGKNISQEGQKGQRSMLTAADVSTLNDLYTEVMAFSKLAQRHFKDQPATRDTFVFEKVAPGGGNGGNGNAAPPAAS